MTHEQASSVEIERKFVLHTVPDGVDAFPVSHIHQGYLVIAPDHEVRIRKKTNHKGTSYTCTYKGGHGITRQEYDMAISEAAFESVWAETEGRRVEKKRYDVTVPGHLEKFEVDVYMDIPGLVVLEVEFPSESAAASFVLPQIFSRGREVTGNQAYANQQLAVSGMPTA